jgi:tetratricopeptide (TPR) repeat protein
VAGWYAPLDKDLHFYYERERHDFTIDVMFHEGNHMLTHFIDERVWYPAWINEGLGEYYGASEWDPETKTMTTGGLQSSRMAVLWNVAEGEGGWQGLEALIRTPRLDAIKYSWAWSFCHFLMSTPKYADAFKKLYVGFARDNKIPKKPHAWGMVAIEPDDQIEAIKRYLKVKDLDALEAEWHDYIKTKLTLDREDIDYEGAGWILQMYGERYKARTMFKKAIDAGSKSAFVYYGYANLQYDRGKLKSARENVEKAIELDPLHGPARHLLGRIVYETGDEKEGERLMDLGMELAPDEQSLWVLSAMTKLKKERTSPPGDGGDD